MKILVVEDDKKVSVSLKKGLEEAEFSTVTVPSVHDAREALAEESFQLVVLDLGLPDGDGLDLLEVLKDKKPAPPALVLTARDSIEDRVKGLDHGADDYLVKPFAFSELLARIRALLRRGAPDQMCIRVADLEMDLVKRQVTRAGNTIDLSPREYDLLLCFARNAGRPVSRDLLSREVWNVESSAVPMDNVIDVHISHLREKLDREFPGKMITTIRGVGFQLGESE